MKSEAAFNFENSEKSPLLPRINPDQLESQLMRLEKKRERKFSSEEQSALRNLIKCCACDQQAITWLNLMEIILSCSLPPSRIAEIFFEVYEFGFATGAFVIMISAATVAMLIAAFGMRENTESKNKMVKLLQAINKIKGGPALFGLALGPLVRIAGMIRGGNWGNNFVADAFFYGLVGGTALLAGLINTMPIRKALKNLGICKNAPGWLRKIIEGVDRFVRDSILFYQIQIVPYLIIGLTNKRLGQSSAAHIGRLAAGGTAGLVTAVANTVASTTKSNSVKYYEKKFLQLTLLSCLLGAVDTEIASLNQQNSLAPIVILVAVILMSIVTSMVVTNAQPYIYTAGLSKSRSEEDLNQNKPEVPASVLSDSMATGALKAERKNSDDVRKNSGKEEEDEITVAPESKTEFTQQKL